MMLPSSSICGVTSSTMPEKNGCTVIVGEVCVALPVVVLVVDTLVTKNSSVPTLSTAFWLLSVATRGLDSTCTLPCVSRKVSSAAKLEVGEREPEDVAAGDGVIDEVVAGGAAERGADARWACRSRR